MMRLSALMLLLLLLTGCQLTQADITPSPTPLEATAPVATAPAIEGVPDTTAEVTTESVLFPTETGAPRMTTAPSTIMLGGVLTWIGSREVPALNNRTAQIAVIGTDGAISNLLEVEDAGRPAEACGERATSPDGSLFAFYNGGDRGTLHMMRGMQPPVVMGTVEYLTCLGMGTFVYSPSGGRFAYLDYERGATRNDFTDGVLRVFDSISLAQVASFEQVVAYDLGETDAAYLRFFANAQGVADEASVNVWDGTNEREIATLTPTEQNCRFTTGQILRPDDEILLLMGQRCLTANAVTRWVLYSVRSQDNTVTLVDSDQQPGAFVTFARTNTLLLSPDRATAYFTVPDGIAGNTVALAAIALADMSISVPIPRQAVYPNFSGTVNATPRLSADGEHLALVVTSPNNDNQLVIVTLNTPAATPISISAGSRQDTISALSFDATGGTVYYVGGGADNGVYALDTMLGTTRRIARGQFGDALALAGDQIALLDTRRVTDPAPLAFLDLVLVNSTTGAKRTIFQGERIEGGGSTYAVPLTWR